MTDTDKIESKREIGLFCSANAHLSGEQKFQKADHGFAGEKISKPSG